MLWIRTQNGRSLMYVREVNVKGRHVQGIVGRSAFTEWSNSVGKYESNERATEVLHEIFQKLEEAQGQYTVFSMPEK